MKGVAASVVSALLLLISIASIMLVYNYVTRLSAEATARGEETMVDAKITPKLLALACFDTYGYMTVSTDDALKGLVYYEVKYGLDRVSSGLSSTNISGVGSIYFNASMYENKDYTVTISSKYWKLMEYCTSIRDPGLLLFLPFNESNVSFAKDWSLNGNDAYVNATWVNGTSDYAPKFDGMGQYAKVNSTSGFGSPEFTLAFWVFKDSSDADNEGIIESGSFFARSQSSGNAEFKLSGGESLNVPLSNQVWRHFTMAYDGAVLSLYENCTLNMSVNSTYLPQGGDFYIGKGQSGYFNGSIDEIYFFSRPLEESEIKVFCPPRLTVQENAYNGTLPGGPAPPPP